MYASTSPLFSTPAPTDFMCMWEAMDNARQRSSADSPLRLCWKRHGAAGMREICIAVTTVACTAWDRMTDDEREDVLPFDWCFCPHWVASCVDWGAL